MSDQSPAAETAAPEPFAACWWLNCDEPPTLRFLVQSHVAAIFDPGGCSILDIAVCEHHAETLNLKPREVKRA